MLYCRRRQRPRKWQREQLALQQHTSLSKIPTRPQRNYLFAHISIIFFFSVCAFFFEICKYLLHIFQYLKHKGFVHVKRKYIQKAPIAQKKGGGGQYLCAHTHTHTHTLHPHVHTKHTNAHARARAHTHIHTKASSVCTRQHTRPAHTNTHTHTHKHIHAHTHKHTNTLTPAGVFRCTSCNWL
jgi:hypothetical protein